MSRVRLTWVVDDVAPAPLRAEHGYALWIESAAGQVLFDTGGSGETLIHNLELLDLDPQKLDAVILSHAHDDHTGGLPMLAPRLSPGTPVFAHPTLFRARYSRKSGTPQTRGIPVTRTSLDAHVSFRFNRDPIEVLSGVWTTGEIAPRPEPEGRSRWHFIERAGAFVADPYEDDLSVVLEVAPDRLVLICGCCHAGLLNTLATVRRHWSGEIAAIVGGVHLAHAPEAVVARTVDVLSRMPGLQYLWLGHCSGAAISETARVALVEVEVAQRTAGQHLVLERGEVVCA